MKYGRALVRCWPGTVPADGELSAGDLDFLRIFLHYLANDFFLPVSQLQPLPRSRHIPAAIVKGRFDIASGMHTAFRLLQSWSEAHFITPLGGCAYAAEPMRTVVRNAVHRLLRL